MAENKLVKKNQATTASALDASALDASAQDASALDDSEGEGFNAQNSKPAKARAKRIKAHADSQEIQVSVLNKQPKLTQARFDIGDLVRHRRFGFQGIIFDVDPEFNHSEEWYQSIPKEMRPRKDQPFYHLCALTADEEEPYIGYVSEQNLEKLDQKIESFEHPGLQEYFDGMTKGKYVKRDLAN